WSVKRRTSRPHGTLHALRSTLHALTLCALVLLPAAARPAVAAAGPLTLAGVLGEAPYRIAVPADWNGTLVLYSHGYIPAGVPNQAQDAPDAATASWLLDHGYALAGSAYSATGWAVAEALDDQVALLDFFARRVGPPQRVIAWGQSLGGLITAGLAQRYPGRFAGALPMCGILAGSVGAWNEGLDAAFAFKTLAAPAAEIQLIHIAGEGGANLQVAQRALDAAQQTPQGRARIALAAALANVPGWFDPARPEPAADDDAAREEAQYRWSQRSLFLYAFGFRAELERRAGGNPSWNTGVDYRAQLAGSVDYSEVVALYRQAGLDLDADLDALARAPRIAADPAAVAYLAQNVVFDGELRLPVLTMHTTADGLVRVQNERAYADVVQAAGAGELLRQVYVARPGHCAFTPAEMLAAFQALVARLDAGRWDDGPHAPTPAALARAAVALGPDLNAMTSFQNARTPTPPAFVSYRPVPFPRPFDARAAPAPGAADAPASALGPDRASAPPGLAWLWLAIAAAAVVAGTATIASRRHAGRAD
ncbi:MAG TPA: DUF6351 family protein, partial [Thermomicrobiales bacterium]|nr:DUF6351 family protein [Thermomicrobiales bacterium]